MAADAPRNEGPPPRVRLNVSANGRGVTASIRNEDHTLGNALRWACVQSRDVNFCGYSIPHPSEPVMNIRVQTDVDELRKGLQTLVAATEVLEKKYASARRVKHAMEDE